VVIVIVSFDARRRSFSYVQYRLSSIKHCLWPDTAVITYSPKRVNKIALPCNYMATHLLTQERWKAKLAWLVDPKRTVYLQSGHLSTIDQGESASQKPTS